VSRSCTRGFDGDRLAHDVAVVKFPKDSIAGVAPIELPRARLLDRLQGHRSFRLRGRSGAR